MQPPPRDVTLPNGVFSIETAFRTGDVWGGTEHPTSAGFQEAAAHPKGRGGVLAPLDTQGDATGACRRTCYKPRAEGSVAVSR